MTDPTNTPAEAYGNSTAFEGNSSHAPDCLVASPIAIPRDGALVELGMIAKVTGPRAILALYKDRVGSPGPIVGWTMPFAIQARDQRIALAGSATPKLAVGTYWIAVEFESQASIGIDYTDKAAIVKYVRKSFGLPLPEEFPAPSVFTGQRFNCYLLLQ